MIFRNKHSGERIMKKSFLSIALGLTVFLTAVFQASAATRFSDGVYTFEKTEFQTAVITDYESTDSNITVPEKVLGYPVVGIGSFVFFENSGITEVTLPSTTASIGEYAFAKNSGLTAVTIPQACETIDSTAFWKSPNVTIRCWYGSAAHAYAKNNQMAYLLMDNVLLGDPNNDQVINVNDVTAIQRHVALLQKLEGIGFIAGDINQNGTPDIGDATALQSFLAEYETAYPIGEPLHPE